MKILLIPEFSETGGSRSFLLSVLDYYKRNNWEVTLYVENDMGKVADELLKQKLIKGFVTHSKRPKIFEFFPASLFWEIFPIKHIIANADPDIIFVSNQRFGLWLSAFLANKKTIYFCHSYPTTMNLISKKTMGRFLDKHLSNTKSMVTVSKFAANSIEKVLNLHNKVKVIYNTSTFDDSQKIILHKGINILTVSNLEYYKNPKLWVKVAIEVVSKNDNVNFIWVGTGKSIEDFRKKVPLKYRKNIVFLGKKDHSQVKKYFEQADIYFQPSLIESHGISVIEAMSMGLPCIVSNVGGLPESVQDGVNGFVVDGQNITSYVNAISKLIKNTDLRQKMGDKGESMFEQKFSYSYWKKEMDSLHKL